MSSPSAKILVNVKVYEVISAGIKAGTVPSEVLEQIDLANGTTDGSACDKVYIKTETAKAASSSTDYDLAAGLTDIDGNSITMAEVCLLAVFNRRATALAYLLVGPKGGGVGFGILSGSKGFWNAALGAGGGNVVGPASTATAGNRGTSFLLLYDYTGVPVVAGTGDIFQVVCSAVAGDTNTWDVIVIGRSA